MNIEDMFAQAMRFNRMKMDSSEDSTLRYISEHVESEELKREISIRRDILRSRLVKMYNFG